jgi:hypothetical protein
MIPQEGKMEKEYEHAYSNAKGWFEDAALLWFAGLFYYGEG